MSVQEKVRKFIVENFYVADATELTNDASLISAGWVDSTGMLEVIAFLEEEFGIRISDAEMIPSNLDGIDRIAAFVARKQGEVRVA
jgi:acyl carrier protein